MPPARVERKPSMEDNSESHAPVRVPRRAGRRPHKLPKRSLSLGEVKKTISATRIQSFVRMYLQQYNFKMMLQRQRIAEIERESARDIRKIQETLKQKQLEFQDRMQRDLSLGIPNYIPAPVEIIDVDAEDDPADVEQSLRDKMAYYEVSNENIQKQIDRLEAANRRMQGGTKIRENALREVSGREKKLQQINDKLNKTKHEFQKGCVEIEEELSQMSDKVKREQKLKESTKTCLRQVADLVRTRLVKKNAELAAELEKKLPSDCLF